MKTSIMIMMLALVGGIAAATGVGNSVSVSTVSLATVEDSEEVEYSVVDLVIPRLSGDRELTEAFLDLYVDVSSMVPDSLTDGTVSIEVTPMPTLVNGKLGTISSASIAKRSVRTGSDRPVRIYVTRFVRAALEELGDAQSSAEVSLLVGPISGDRRGRFDAKAVPGGVGGAKALLTVRTQAYYTTE